MQAFLGIGRRKGMLKVGPLRTDLFACSKIVLVFILNEGVHVFQDSTAVLVGMLIMPYDFQLFSCVFTSIAKSILSYPLSSQITWDMSPSYLFQTFLSGTPLTEAGKLLFLLITPQTRRKEEAVLKNKTMVSAVHKQGQDK